MLNVSEQTKRAYMSDVAIKSLRVRFPSLGLIYRNDSIETESLKMTEAVSTKESVEFVGCIATSLQINIYGIQRDIKNQPIEVYIQADNTDEIPLFKGIVDSVVIDSDRNFKKITAYDEMYRLSNTDVADIYNNMYFPCSLRAVRQTMLAKLDIDEILVDLPNDDVMIEKQYQPVTLKALDVMKAICQINGVWGHINREGIFEYIFPPSTEGSCVPIQLPFQVVDKAAGAYASIEALNFYEKLEYQEYQVKLIEKLTIRQNDTDRGVTVGEGTNEFIIQGNIFTEGLEADVIEEIATNIYEKIKGFSYYPYKMTCNGLPYLEVGKDAISCRAFDTKYQTYREFDLYVLNRTIKGVQFLRDDFDAKGEEERSVFISDLNQKVDQLKQATDKIVSDINSGKIGGFKFVEVQSAADIPSPPEANTGYYKVGEVSYFDRVVM